jgi:mgtE-like transporter
MARGTVKVIKSSVPLLTTLIFVEIMGGVMLHRNFGVFETFPILLATVPFINAMGGNVGSVLGSRISSGLHVGYYEAKFWQPQLKKEVGIALALGLLVFGAFSLLIPISHMLYSGELLPVSEIIKIYTLVLITGIVLTLLVIILAIGSSIISYKVGADPDDVVIPTLTTFVDLSGIICLLLAMNLIGV